jgi:hypothetical protein
MMDGLLWASVLLLAVPLAIGIGIVVVVVRRRG